MSPAARRILSSVVVIVLVALAAGVWFIRGPGPMAFADGPKVALADYKAADPAGVPASLAKASLVERGEYLARAADCMVCHTTQGGQAFAGGLGFKLPFGTLYSTNITPDKETGIGNYSDEEFLAAVHRGTRRDGARLYPAMPFTSYTYMTDADALAIKAYLFSLAPVKAAAPWRNVIADRADHKHRRVNVRQGDRLAFDEVAALCQIVVEEQLAQIFGMHPVRQAGGVGVPGHQVARRSPFAHQVFAADPRPDQIVRAQ